MMGYERLGYGAGHMVNGGFGFAGLAVGFFVFALVVALVIWLIVGRKHGSHTTPTYQQMQPGTTPFASEDTALAIARERLAKGEIDAEQYNVIATALKG